MTRGASTRWSPSPPPSSPDPVSRRASTDLLLSWFLSTGPGSSLIAGTSSSTMSLSPPQVTQIFHQRWRRSQGGEGMGQGEERGGAEENLVLGVWHSGCPVLLSTSRKRRRRRHPGAGQLFHDLRFSPLLRLLAPPPPSPLANAVSAARLGLDPDRLPLLRWCCCRRRWTPPLVTRLGRTSTP